MLQNVRTFSQSETKALLNGNDPKMMQRWSALGRDTLVSCGTKPFTIAIERKVENDCRAASSSNSEAGCICVGREFAQHYTLSQVALMSDPGMMHKFAQQTLSTAQVYCYDKSRSQANKP